MSNTITKQCKIQNCVSVGHLKRNGDREFLRGLCAKHYQRWQRHKDPNYIERAFDGRQSHHLYKTWMNIKNRCYSKSSDSYEWYGARGIKVCDSWKDKVTGFPQFVQDMGTRPSERHTVDRIDNDGDYEPSNCRWATKREQNINRRILTRNKSGCAGVSWHSSRNKWVVYASNQLGKSVYLGTYKSLDDAVKVRKQAELDYGYIK